MTSLFLILRRTLSIAFLAVVYSAVLLLLVARIAKGQDASPPQPPVPPVESSAPAAEEIKSPQQAEASPAPDLPPAVAVPSGDAKIVEPASEAVVRKPPRAPAPVEREVNSVEVETPKPDEDTAAADLVPPGQELVNIDFPEPTDIKDIIRAVSLWTGKNVILGKDVAGKVQMISPRKVTKVEAYQAFLSALNLLQLTTVETGKVIKIVPLRSAMKSNLKTFQGTGWTPATDELITQIVPLKYINAKDIQSTLSRLTSSGSMIAYQPTNTLIISDSGFKVRRLLEIIQLLDVQTQQPKIAIVPIRYGDAKAIQGLVQNIFQSGGKSKDYLSYKILADERTNSVIIFGPPRTIADVKGLVRRFDIRIDDPSRQSQIHVRPLDYADAEKLASTLSALAPGGNAGRRPPSITSIGPNSRGSRNTANEAPPVASLDNNVKITADKASNSLLITGSRSAYEAINSIVRKLDIRKSQVFVEAELLDLNIGGNFSFKSSIFAGFGGKDEKSSRYATTWEAAPFGSIIEAKAAGATSTATAEKVGKTFAEDLTIGVISGKEVEIPGLGMVSPGALIKLIKSDSYSRTLASPQMLTANNEEAEFSVGKKIFYKTNDATASGSFVQNVKSEKVDLSLKIKPNISHSNYVTMKIDLNANSGSVDQVSQIPSVQTRKASQIVTVKNSQTVVITGLMQTSQFDVYKKIPLLGDLPIIGWLFRNTSKTDEKNSLMIFLTPHIVHGANDLAAIYQQKVAERDELLAKVYGSSFKEDDFYRSLPRPEDGQFHADAFDVIDQKSSAERNRGLMKDMGYSTDEITRLEDKLKAGSAVENTPAGTDLNDDSLMNRSGNSAKEEPYEVPMGSFGAGESPSVGGDSGFSEPIDIPMGGDGGGDSDFGGGGDDLGPPPEVDIPEPVDME